MTVRRIAIEQAIAYGRTLDWICDNLGVHPRDVDEVLARMDEIAADEDNARELRKPLVTR